MLRDAVLVAGKDLRIEIRSRVGLNQVGPFAVAVLLLFGLALGPDRPVLAPASAGLFWVAVLLSTVLAVQRSYAIESADAARDGLRLSGLDPAGIFLGKATAVVAQLLVLEAALTARGRVALRGSLVGRPCPGRRVRRRHPRSRGGRHALRGRGIRAADTRNAPPACCSCPWSLRSCLPQPRRGTRASREHRAVQVAGWTCSWSSPCSTSPSA